MSGLGRVPGRGGKRAERTQGGVGNHADDGNDVDSVEKGLIHVEYHILL